MYECILYPREDGCSVYTRHLWLELALRLHDMAQHAWMLKLTCFRMLDDVAIHFQRYEDIAATAAAIAAASSHATVGDDRDSKMQLRNAKRFPSNNAVNGGNLTATAAASPNNTPASPTQPRSPSQPVQQPIRVRIPVPPPTQTPTPPSSSASSSPPMSTPPPSSRRHANTDSWMLAALDMPAFQTQWSAASKVSVASSTTSTTSSAFYSPVVPATTFKDGGIAARRRAGAARQHLQHHHHQHQQRQAQTPPEPVDVRRPTIYTLADAREAGHYGYDHGGDGGGGGGDDGPMYRPIYALPGEYFPRIPSANNEEGSNKSTRALEKADASSKSKKQDSDRLVPVPTTTTTTTTAEADGAAVTPMAVTPPGTPERSPRSRSPRLPPRNKKEPRQRTVSQTESSW